VVCGVGGGEGGVECDVGGGFAGYEEDVECGELVHDVGFEREGQRVRYARLQAKVSERVLSWCMVVLTAVRKNRMMGSVSGMGMVPETEKDRSLTARNRLTVLSSSMSVPEITFWNGVRLDDDAAAMAMLADIVRGDGLESIIVSPRLLKCPPAIHRCHHLRRESAS
jgi:hypothetical protein